MGEVSGITWTRSTFNIVMGCNEVSPACDNCYARTLVTGRMGHQVWGKDAPRQLLSAAYWKKPLKWNRDAAASGERHLVFSSSLADVFEDHPTVAEQRVRLFELIEATPHLTWLLLTKRAPLIARYLPPSWIAAPRPNVWLGVTAENQKYADARIPHLLATPAKVRFVSVEPMLGPVDLSRWIAPTTVCQSCAEERDGIVQTDCHGCHTDNLITLWGNAQLEQWREGRRYDGALRDGPELHWVICGGESGSSPRPMPLEWARSLRDQASAAGVAYFMKQVGESWSRAQKALHPLRHFHRHGANPAEWDADLRVQEHPRT